MQTWNTRARSGRSVGTVFLERMYGLIPWQRLEERIRQYYPKAGRGRQPYDLSVMLRVHCVQLFYNLSDPGMEDLLYEAVVGAAVRGTAAVGGAARREHDTAFPSVQHELGESV